MTKRELKSGIIDKIYTKKEVLDILEKLSSNTPIKNRRLIIDEIKKGDVFLCNIFKRRPAIVIKVLKNGTVIAVPMTTTENHHTLIESTSRFLGKSFFSNSLFIETVDMVKENFICVYDNPIAVNMLIKELAILYKFILK